MFRNCTIPFNASNGDEDANIEATAPVSAIASGNAAPSGTTAVSARIADGNEGLTTVIAGPVEAPHALELAGTPCLFDAAFAAEIVGAAVGADENENTVVANDPTSIAAHSDSVPTFASGTTIKTAPAADGNDGITVTAGIITETGGGAVVAGLADGSATGTTENAIARDEATATETTVASVGAA